MGERYAEHMRPTSNRKTSFYSPLALTAGTPCSAQRLANGNTVVAWTRKGIVDEVRADGTLLSRATLETAPGQIATPYRVTRINNLYGYARP